MDPKPGLTIFDKPPTRTALAEVVNGGGQAVVNIEAAKQTLLYVESPANLKPAGNDWETDGGIKVTNVQRTIMVHLGRQIVRMDQLVVLDPATLEAPPEPTPSWLSNLW